MPRSLRSPLLVLLMAIVTISVGCTPTEIAQPPSEKAATPAVSENKADANEERKLIEESWDVMYIQGTKVGYGRTSRYEAKGELFTEADQTLSIERFGQKTDQKLKFSCRLDPQGKLLAVRSSLSGGDQSIVTLGTINDGFLKLTTSTNGKERRDTSGWNEGTLGYFGLEDSLREHPLKPGEERRIKWLQAVLNTAADEQLRSIDFEETELLGEKKKLLRVESEAKIGTQAVKSTYWVDEAGRMWKSRRAGLDQESFRTTKEIAMRPATKSFDLGEKSLVRVARALAGPTEHSKVVYRARLKEGDPLQEFTACPAQTLRALDARTTEITVLRIRPGSPKDLVGTVPPVPADSASNSLIQSDDPTIIAFAKSVAPDETNSWKIALEIEHMIHRSIRKKNFSQAFGTAADTMRTLEGDCTEHAVLLAAVCRARGIPARTAAGLVYYAPKQAFAYHMWNEVWIDDRWIALDATLGKGGIGGGHLKLFDSNLEGADAFAAFLPVVNVLGRLQLEIVEAE